MLMYLHSSNRRKKKLYLCIIFQHITKYICLNNQIYLSKYLWYRWECERRQPFCYHTKPTFHQFQLTKTSFWAMLLFQFGIVKSLGECYCFNLELPGWIPPSTCFSIVSNLFIERHIYLIDAVFSYASISTLQPCVRVGQWVVVSN